MKEGEPDEVGRAGREMGRGGSLTKIRRGVRTLQWLLIKARRGALGTGLTSAGAGIRDAQRSEAGLGSGAHPRRPWCSAQSGRAGASCALRRPGRLRAWSSRTQRTDAGGHPCLQAPRQVTGRARRVGGSDHSPAAEGRGVSRTLHSGPAAGARILARGSRVEFRDTGWGGDHHTKALLET